MHHFLNQENTNRLNRVRRALPTIFLDMVFIAGLYFLSINEYVVFHTFIELFTIIIGLGICLIVINSHKYLDNPFLLVIGASFFFVSAFDLLHMLAYKGVDIVHSEVTSQVDLSTQLWLLARIFQSVSFLVASLMIAKKNVRATKIFYILTAAFLLSLLNIFHFHNLPVTYIEGSGLTSHKVITEYFIITATGLSAFFLSKQRDKLEKKIFQLLILSLFTSIVSEFFFTLYVNIYGLENYVGHILKLCTFFIIYRAIFVTSIQQPHRILYRNLAESEAKLRDQEYELRQQTLHLQLEKERNEALLTSMSEGLIAIDNSGQILFTNRALEEMTGRSATELYSHDINEVIPLFTGNGAIVNKGSRPLNIIVKAKSKQIHNENRYYLRHKNGRKVWLSITATPILNEKSRVGALAIYHDVTKEREMEQTKADFLAFAAHQLKTPLTTLTLSAELMLKGALGNGINSSTKKYLADIYRETKGMKEIISTFMDISRVEMGLLPLNPSPQNIAQVIDGVLENLQMLFKEKNLVLNKKYRHDLPLLPIDFQAIKIILDNLITNAIKYSEPASTITVDITITRTDVIISVQDEGRGIPPKQQPHIFEKMYRGDNNDPETGIGLGLYVAKLIVEQSGGKIWFESKIENGASSGTIFYVSFPFTGMKKKKIELQST